MLLGARQTMWGGGAAPEPTPPYWGLCFTAEQANSTVAMTGRGSSATGANLLYSTDPTDPTSWTRFVVGTTTVTLANIGDKVWLKAGEGGNTKFYGGSTNYARFSLGGLVAASGSIQSLINGTSETLALSEANAFRSLFQNCTSLTAAPVLPATTLTQGCYYQMFYRCSALRATPSLPAISLEDNCYRSMFSGCTSLTNAADLPATTLSVGCYSSMFSGCSSLTTAPELHSTTLAKGCYFYMFSGCTSLSTIRTAQTQAWGDGSSSDPTYMWVDGVAATGTFYCSSQLGTNEPGGITRGANACPEGWTVVNI